MAAYNLSKFKKIVPQLAPGESLIAGSFAMAPGGVGRTMGGAVGGAVGAAIAGAGTGAAGAFQLPQKFVLGLTNRQLLVCKPDLFMGNPKSVLYGIPLTDIASAGWGKTGKLSQQAEVTMRDGRVLVVEAMRGKGKGWLENLLAQLQPLLAD